MSKLWFLIKLLKPVIVTSTEGKPQNIGFKLLSLLKDVDAAREGMKMNEELQGLVKLENKVVNEMEILHPSRKTKILLRLIWMDSKPSNWEVVSVKQKKSRAVKALMLYGWFQD